MKLRINRLAIVLTCLATSGIAIAGQTTGIDRFTIASGGGNSSNGRFAITGTIGQYGATTTGTDPSGGGFSLVGGFWVNTSTDGTQATPGDMDCDGVVDLNDVAPFALSLVDASGYDDSYPDCSADNADLNDDTQVDGRDVAGFIQLLLQ